MRFATLAAILAVAALLFFAFGCITKIPPPGESNQTPVPPSDIPPPPSDSGAPAAPPTGGDAPPPAPI